VSKCGYVTTSSNIPSNLHIKKRLGTEHDDRGSLWGDDLVLVRKLRGMFRNMANISTKYSEMACSSLYTALHRIDARDATIKHVKRRTAVSSVKERVSVLDKRLPIYGFGLIWGQEQRFPGDKWLA
jgi:hypothetical protein